MLALQTAAPRLRRAVTLRALLYREPGTITPVFVKASIGDFRAAYESWSRIPPEARVDGLLWREARAFREQRDLAVTAFFKDVGSAVAKTHSDEGGANFRWVTLHPNGRDEKGVHVMIRESRQQPGVWHVVQGAGGKLNYLRLTDVKSPEEYKRRAEEKRKASKEQDKVKKESERQRKLTLTDEEKEAEKIGKRTEQDRREAAEQHLELQKREFIANIAKTLGWEDKDWKFEATAEKLRAAGTEEKRISQLERDHLKRVYNRAQDAVKATKRQLLLDHEMRAAAELGEVPLHSEDENVIALNDLDPDRVKRGLGYQRDVTKMSDAEITRELANEDIASLRADLEATQNAASPQSIADTARIREMQQQLRAAELLHKGADKTPEELVARDGELATAIGDVKAEQMTYQAELKDLRGKIQEGTIKKDEAERLALLEEDDFQNQKRIEHLNDERDGVAILQGSQAPVVKAEKKTIQNRRQEEREAEIRAEKGEAGVQGYRAMREMLERGAAKYRAEISALKETGLLQKPELPVAAPADPKAAVEILKHAKAIEGLEKGVKKALKGEQPIDEKLYGKPYFVETRSAKLEDAVQRDVDNAIAELRTKSFLRELEDADKDPTLQSLTDTERRESLDRHLSAGSYNALNNASLTTLKAPVIGRDVADVLGTAGAAQLLARAIQKAKPEDVNAIREGLEKFHLENHMAASEEAMRSANDLYDQAREIELGEAKNVSDLTELQEMNARRRDMLLQARETMGRTLGEMEAHAALVMAMRSKPANEIHVAMGPLAADSAIRQARAIGLGRDDYVIDSDGTNRFLTIKASGLDKLTHPIDAEELRLNEEVTAIKKGERDEEGWLPPGMVSYSATSFTDPRLTAESIGAHQQSTSPYEKWGGGGDIRRDVVDHVAARIADGEDPNDVLPSVLGNLRRVPEAHREGVVRALDELMPTEVDGKRVKADVHETRLREMAEEFLERRYPDQNVASFHAQGLKGFGTAGESDRQNTARAMHLALGADPRAISAFKPHGDLTTQDQAGLRHYFNTEIAKVDPKTGVNKADIDKRVGELGAEPEKESSGLFGKQTNPAWAEWNQARQAIVAEAQDGSTAWSEYVRTHHGVAGAYEAIQDRLKGDFIGRFRTHYAAVHGQPLRVGKRSIRNAERHLSFVDPEERERLRKEEAELNDSARNRTQGKYATGSVKEKVDRLLQMQEIERQNQMGMFGTKEAAKPELKVGAGERLSLGERAENQIASLMGNVGQNFRGHETEKVDLFPNLSMSGKAKVKGADVDLSAQQRTIKAFLARKRIGAFLGTGSGKTPISIGAFTAAASDPKSGVKRGVFVVPSQVQGQFHGEFARFTEPGKFKWHAAPGAPAADRMAAHQDKDTHAVVMTHQGFRDDMLKLVSEHLGMEPEKAGEHFMGLDRKARGAALKEAWKKAGIDYQASFLDEGHVTLDRKGKPDSLLSAMMTAVSDNTPHYMAMTADPAKNDSSELRSQLDKLYPDGRYSSEQDWHRRYGLNTSASREALRREVSGNFLINHIQPPITANRAEERVELHPKQREGYSRVMQLFGKARADRSKGKINVDAIRELSPVSFEGKPAEEHEAIARRLSDNLGIIKEAALHRVVNLAPPEQNAKIQAILGKLNGHDVKNKPPVIFAHNLESVAHLEKALGEAGHRVVTLTGEHSTKEKDVRRRKFNPPQGVDPEADVMILSDAGATGLNLQRGQTLIHYDTPQTAMVHAQRNGRIHRLGQTQDVDLLDVVTNTPYEEKARQRLAKKYDLRSINETDAIAGEDEHSLGAFIHQAREQRNQLQNSKMAKVAA